MKPMLLTPAGSVPKNGDWLYEIKYDGFRCILIWTEETPKLMSRNNNELTHLFPEIIEYCKNQFELIQPFLPLTLDGEIVYLANNFQSDFSIVQSRGKTRSEAKINEAATRFPCNFIVFDLLVCKGEDLTQLPLTKRKVRLDELFSYMQMPSTPSYLMQGYIQKITSYEDEEFIWEVAKKHNSEGIIAKKKTSLWESGKRTNQWLKVKNWRIVTVIVTKFEQENQFFIGSVFKDDELLEVTTFKHGLSDEEIQTLSTLFQTKGQRTSINTWELPPSICVDVACIDFDGKKLREPRFNAFRLETTPSDVTWQQMLRQLNPVPEIVEITHPDKPVWPAMGLEKDDYIYYLQQVAPFLLPFLNNRLLTAIRFPHGVPGESFYQKNAPEYTPKFIQTKINEDIEYILCNNIETLLWLGNQLAIELHIPFQTVDTQFPTEIVFDLDPPSVQEFSLAIEAALKMKAIFDQFNLISFIKTSGGKGLQIYLPLPKDTFTYEDTRVFMEFVCLFLCEQEPKWFTIERLKKNRDNKLYLDYVQHAEGKTIISPYSARGNDNGYIATPLQWHEVNSKLTPSMFPIPAVLERIKTIGDPFKDFFAIEHNRNFTEVLNTLKNLTKKK